MTDRERRQGVDDEDRLAAIYRRHSAAVLAYALRRCPSDEAADVVSESFVVVWRRLDEVPDEPATRPWLFGVARRVLANQRRSTRRRSALVRKVASHLAPALDHRSPLDDHGDAQLIRDALQQLDEADRELLLLANWEQLSPAEIAIVLGISGSAARKRLFRARNRLAVVLEQIDGGPDNGEHQPEIRTHT